MGKNSASKTETIKADAAEVYDLLAQVENYPKWMDEFKKAEILETADDGYAARSRFVVSSMGIDLDMVLEYDRVPNERISWTLTEGKMMKKNDGTYTLKDNGDGTTDVTYELETDTSAPLPGMVQKKLTKKVVTDTLKSVKKQAES